MAKPKKFIQEIDMEEGALRAKAKRAGAITKQGTIDLNWLKQQAKRKDKTGRQARWALTMRGFKHPKKKK